MRTPATTPPSVARRTEDHHITETRRYKVITPLFGGGVTPGEADPVTVVRATEVRGHLRFWWRAINVSRYRTLADLKRHEHDIWGSTEVPSSVQVKLIDSETNQGTFEVAFQVDGSRKVTPSDKIAHYAAFPLLPDKDEQRRVGWKSEPLLLDVQFTLEIRYPKSVMTHVQSALWAWETFGGIGARTRRGFGALQWLDTPNSYPPQTSQVDRQIRAQLVQLTTEPGSLSQVPALIPTLRFKITSALDDPITVWKGLISALQQFRQDRYGKRFGLSKWPEANEIRRLNGLKPKLPNGQSESGLVRKFPRAAFGLPIVFHMAHDRDISSDALLEGQPDQANDNKYDRLASPLILRPLACAGGKYVGLAAILHAPSEPPNGLRLAGAPGSPVVRSKLSSAEAKQIDPLDGNPDVLQAFLDWL